MDQAQEEMAVKAVHKVEVDKSKVEKIKEVDLMQEEEEEEEKIIK